MGASRRSLWPLTLGLAMLVACTSSADQPRAVTAPAESARTAPTASADAAPTESGSTAPAAPAGTAPTSSGSAAPNAPAAVATAPPDVGFPTGPAVLVVANYEPPPDRVDSTGAFLPANGKPTLVFVDAIW